jgi:hypothetical protein
MKFKKARKIARGEVMFSAPRDADGYYYMEEEREGTKLVSVTYRRVTVP